MKDDIASALKQSRKMNNLSVRQAGELAAITGRGWRKCEASTLRSTNRSPSESVIRCFYDRSGIPIPAVVSASLTKRNEARVLCITSMKGGVGKSPITIDVAATLVERGCKVAVVTYDSVYQAMMAAEERPAVGTLVSKIDFYGYSDVFFSKAEVTSLRKNARDIMKNGSLWERRSFEFGVGVKIDTIEKNLASPTFFSEVKKKYDYVFLDINREIELVRVHADFITIILDTNCAQSISSAEKFLVGLHAVKSKRRFPRCYGLMTHNDVGGKNRAFDEYYSDHVVLDENTSARLESSERQVIDRRERILKKIKNLPLLRLDTRLTNAHEIVIERYNSTRELMDGYAYFDSVLDIAPDSHAAEEIALLTAELVDFRL